MRRNVQVRVFGNDGRPVVGARVNCYVYQFAAGGYAPERTTDVDGTAEFDLDVDEYAEISLSVDGSEKSPRGPVRGTYRLTG